ncbi:hypothetical protein [Streptomyces sp. NBC_01497]|uniref:hypothetical protein n=1 Tax=Streptomyces sp. NBC_01497 TaxID=2903885 RepID=UPI002E36E3AD|nr:hypothetical protein [Streptomyces sp. NBC_01497]
MAEPQSNARLRADAGAPTSGVIHVRTRLTADFTVISNVLARRRGSAVTVGVAAYIRSLPDGSPVSITALCRHFSEGEILISRALRELEADGYLERRRERLPRGQIRTRTYFTVLPGADPDPDPGPDPGPDPRHDPEPDPDPDPGPDPGPDPDDGPPEPPNPPRPRRRPVPAQARPTPPPPPAPPASDAEAAPTGPSDGVDSARYASTSADPAGPGPSVAGEMTVSASAGGASEEPVPLDDTDPRAVGPEEPGPLDDADPRAVGVLASLRWADPRLVLSAREAARLAPAVTQWLAAGVQAPEITRILTTRLPDRFLTRPVGILAFRLREVPLPVAPLPTRRAYPELLTVQPFQTCDGCERAFRAPVPGRCKDCPPVDDLRAAG